MRIAQPSQQHPYLLKGELAPRLPAALVELGNHRIELIESCCVRHGHSSIEGRIPESAAGHAADSPAQQQFQRLPRILQAQPRLIL